MIPAPSDPFSILLSQAGTLLPMLTGKTSITSGSVDPSALQSSNDLYNLLVNRGTTTSATDKVVQDIIYRTQLAFAPVLGEEKGAGAYNSTTKKLLADNFAAQAVRASSEAALKDQQQAFQTAAELTKNTVNATKTTTTKTPAQLPITNLLGPAALLLLGKKGKKPPIDVPVEDRIPTVIKPADDAADSAAEAVEYGVADSGNVTFDASSVSNQFDLPDAPTSVFYDTGPAAVDSAVSSLAPDVANSVLSTGSDILESFGGLDLLDSAPDVADTASTVADSAPDFFDDIGSFFDWFADGGLVGRDNTSRRAAMTKQSNSKGTKKKGRANYTFPSGKAPGYKDGGKVKIRRYADGGQVNNAAYTLESLKAQQNLKPKPSVITAPKLPTPAKPLTDDEEDVSSLVQSATDAGLINGTVSAAGASGIGSAASLLAKALFAQAQQQLPGDAAEGGTGVATTVAPDVVSTNNSPHASITSAIVAAIENAIAVNALFSIDPDPAVNPSPTGMTGGSAGTADSSPNEGGATTADAGIGNGPSAGDAGVAAAAGSVGGADGTGDSGDGAGAGDGSSAGGTGGDGGGSGSPYAKGGEVRGPGTGTSDSIIARVSDGEYIIPADVVQKKGVDFFDELVDAYHTPSNQRK